MKEKYVYEEWNRGQGAGIVSLQVTSKKLISFYGQNREVDGDKILQSVSTKLQMEKKENVWKTF